MAKTKTYSHKLKDPRWQKKRLLILQRDNWSCLLCGDSKSTLHVHHKKYNGEPWEADDKELATLCEECHFLTEHHKPDIVYKIHKDQGTGKVFITVFTEMKGDLVVSLYIKIKNEFDCVATLKHKTLLRYVETLDRIAEDRELNFTI